MLLKRLRDVGDDPQDMATTQAELRAVDARLAKVGASVEGKKD
jgi:hypothetical protein